MGVEVELWNFNAMNGEKGLEIWVQAEGPALAAHLGRSTRLHEECEQLRGRAQRQLQLRRLMRDPALSHERFRAACLRLMHGGASLMQLLEGLCVRVSFANRVALDGSRIDIAWDFDV